MFNIYNRTKNTNVIRVFFTQLSTISPIHLNCILEHIQVSDINKCIVPFISIDWVKNIKLKEIRNHILFVMLRDFGTVLNDKLYFDNTISDELYQKLYKPDAPLDLHVDKLEPLLQTLYYIKHVKIILDANSVDDIPNNICMYSDWTKHLSENLPNCVYRNYQLLTPIL